MILRIFSGTPLITLLSLSLTVSAMSTVRAAEGQLEVTSLAADVYLHTSYKDLPGFGFFPSNGLVLVRDGKALLIDTAWPTEDTPRLLEWIEQQGYELDAVVVTHFHDDRASGLEFLHGRGVKSFSSRLTQELLAADSAAVTTHVLEDGLPAAWKDHVEVYYPGPGHSRDNHVVWLPEHGVLFGGCLVRSVATSSLGNTLDAELTEWAHSVSRVIERFPSAEIVVPGHGAPGDQRLLYHTQELAASHTE